MTNHVQEASRLVIKREPTTIYEDNDACVAQIKEGYIKSDITKHIPSLFFSYTQELEKNKEVDVQYICSSYNAADLRRFQPPHLETMLKVLGVIYETCEVFSRRSSRHYTLFFLSWFLSQWFFNDKVFNETIHNSSKVMDNHGVVLRMDNDYPFTLFITYLLLSC